MVFTLAAVLAKAQPLTFAGNAQHTAQYDTPAQPLQRVRWSTSVNLAQNGGGAHYGAPVITASNSVVVPIRTSNGFKLQVVQGATGVLKYELLTDYTAPASAWTPVYQPVLVPRNDGTRLYYPGAGGTIYFIENLDGPAPGPPAQLCFYTNLANYRATSNQFNQSVFVNTPLTADTNGVIFFGFRVETNGAPAPLTSLQGGFARIGPAGNAIYVLAGTAADDDLIFRDSHNCAPALSNDGSTLYVTVKGFPSGFYSYLLGLDAANLTTKYKVLLRDPRNGAYAGVLDAGTSSPVIGPDGDVYLGVAGNPNDGQRGFLLHFSSDLTTQKIPGGFGWDFTPGIVPTNMVPGYSGSSSYLLFTKYNNYAATSDGDGVNKLALLDPNASQSSPHPSTGGLAEMREVMTVLGCTPDPEFQGTNYPFAVREWCINTTAVNPATASIFAPAEDGYIYRWNLTSNSLAEAFRTGPGIGQPYVPTVIGPDGAVYTINGGTLFSLGGFTNLAFELRSSIPDLRTVISTQGLTFTALVTNLNVSDPAPTGTVTFSNLTYQGATPVLNELAMDVPLSNGVASFTASSLAAGGNNLGNHLITATYNGDGYFQSATVTRAQKVFTYSSITTLESELAALGSNAVVLRATVTGSTGIVAVPTGMVSFWDGAKFMAQVHLKLNGVAAWTNSAFEPGSHALKAIYHSDTRFASSQGDVRASEPFALTVNAPVNGGVQIRFTNVCGAPFTVLGATNLYSPLSEWSVLGSVMEGAPGQFEFIDTQVLDDAQRFYQIRSP